MVGMILWGLRMNVVFMEAIYLRFFSIRKLYLLLLLLLLGGSIKGVCGVGTVVQVEYSFWISFVRYNMVKKLRLFSGVSAVIGTLVDAAAITVVTTMVSLVFCSMVYGGERNRFCSRR